MMKSQIKLLAAIILTGTFPLLQACGGGGDTNDQEGHNHANHEHMEDGNHIHENGEMHDDQMDEMNGDKMQDESSNEIPAPQKFEDVSDEVQEKVRKLASSYLQLKDALVGSNVQKSKAAAEQINEAAMMLHMGGLPEGQTAMLDKHLDVIDANAEKIANASDVEVQRKAFEPLTESVYMLTKAFHANTQKLYYQYCPMAFNNEGAFWISGQEEIRNPYFGDKMLKCGSVEEELEADGK